ncbi:hypothetical protein chiPu_0000686 [Chiloscyllium punctatum]|uniref:Uncharacterized protein n=1 Tax=Chiloscyllium punctatum TaxID=137246 RepID=A0A401RW05_CHIPU|nr:hypothetical protein [Chiloscyllium punctatum]
MVIGRSFYNTEQPVSPWDATEKQIACKTEENQVFCEQESDSRRVDLYEEPSCIYCHRDASSRLIGSSGFPQPIAIALFALRPFGAGGGALPTKGTASGFFLAFLISLSNTGRAALP